MKLNYMSPGKLDEYRSMTDAELLAEFKIQYRNLTAAKKSKASNHNLKELAKELADYQKTHTTDELRMAMEEVERLKEERDEKIKEDLEELKEARAGFEDSIKSFKEHVDVLIQLLAGREV